jgi:hypothetical protein
MRPNVAELVIGVGLLPLLTPNRHRWGRHRRRRARVHQRRRGRSCSGVRRGSQRPHFFGWLTVDGRRRGGWLRGPIVPGSRSLWKQHRVDGLGRALSCPGDCRRRYRRSAAKERFELRNGSEGPWPSTPLNENVGSLYPLRRDRLLQVTQRKESELVPFDGLYSPPVGSGSPTFEPAHLELVPAVRASNGRTPPADESVIEVVLSSATLTLNVHRTFLPAGAGPNGHRACREVASRLSARPIRSGEPASATIHAAADHVDPLPACFGAAEPQLTSHTPAPMART